MRGNSLSYVGVIALLLALIGSAEGQEATSTKPATPPVTITARAGEHENFDRIVFDWPRAISYHVSREGDRVVLHFNAPADVKLNGFSHLGRAHDFAAKPDQNGNLTVSFIVGAHAALKDFTSGNSIAVDILSSTASNTPPQKSEPAATEKSASTPTPAKTSSNAPSAPATAPAPPAEMQAPKPAPVPAVTTASPAAKDAPLALVPPPPKTPQPEAKSSPSPAPPTAATATPPAVAETKASNAPALDLNDTPLLVAALDPHTQVRAAIWQRAGYGYIVFDRKLTLSANELAAGQPALRVALETVDLQKFSGFRFVMPDDTVMRATRDDTVWKIYLSKQQPDVPVSTTLVAQPDFALGSRFLLPLPDAPEPVHMTDPVVGDNLILVPLAQTEAFSVPRRMADFLILPAAQGLIVKPLTDKVIVRAVSDGIEITAEGGLRLSTAIDTGASQQSVQKARAAAAGKSLFDFAAWQGKPGETFTETRQRLQQTIVDVPERERNRARLELARFYFAHGYGEETVALLVWLAKQVPDLMAHADYLALDGAAKILAYRSDEGLKDLASPLFTSQPEIELWQAVGHAELRDWGVAEEKFSSTENLLVGYPEPFYSRFSILAIEAAAAAGKDREAADWLDRLETSAHDEHANPAIEYMHGVLHAKSGRALAAENAWKDVAASEDRLYKIRAELALIDLGVANGSLTPAQAADRLEALRFGWRGDDLEVDILHRLGQLYIQAKNVKSGLSTFAQAVQLYPDSPMAPKIHEEMSQTFHDVFLGDLGKNLSPLDALTLYQQYRSLIPAGADGIAVTRNLAERLVAIDLLEQAGDLLEGLVKDKLQGAEKGHVSARLAAIRLLDHKPDAALTALDYSNGEFLPSDVQNERLLLRAKALSELHRDDEALALLRDNTRESAKLLRADITMHAQHWSDAAKALLDLIGDPPKPGEPLRHDQADWLVNCAIALSLANDQTGLDKLAIDFGAAMAGTPQNDTFRVLTQPEKSGQLQDIAAAQSKIADVNLFQGFLNSYRKAEDSDAAPADNKKP